MVLETLVSTIGALLMPYVAKGGEEFREGDLILYLADMESKQLVWVRHLRKLS